MGLVIFPLPSKELKTNRVLGQHWGAFRKAKLAYQLQCLAVLHGMEFVPEDNHYPVHLHITAYLGSRQKLPDLTDLGTWAKTCLDTMVRFGVFKNDSPRYLSPVTLDARRDTANPRLEMSW